ncbi:metal/formaldehyde-sensitive transcriptional repressor [Magnetospirillum aberrantis]|uniref:Metal/formaldehyde-sensitive transcriptional repressor n=1 Tax=Magnetospirillum aberrantis SpK TaxID=908842 RepID=A0A7C9QVX7_9PROT|nr:metal/formaldehyde-sensitive transcriptional repressor [Magnetospirillum aberrantis]NFV81865.1 metal/formaldehyde-sensitive transcriptional repressor [Magnetospirillum aberrantis SpK]
MSHVFKDKPKLLARIRRIRGQVEAIERSLDGGNDCLEVLQLIASVRGAMNGLMGELIEGHVDHHIVKAPTDDARRQGAEELASILRSYLK